MSKVKRYADEGLVDDGETAGTGARNLALEDKEEEKPKAKRAIVTKEQLEKSGLSLRDYLNRERGLTRRGGSAPSRKESSYEDTGAKIGSQGNFNASAESKPVARTRAGTPVATRKEPTEAEKESGRKFSEEKLKKQREDFENTPLMRAIKGTGGRAEFYKKKREAEEGRYAKGGSVGSASKRGDGIAQRGKTKGRMV